MKGLALLGVATAAGVAFHLPASASAQNPHRQGLWAEFSSGPSVIRVGCTGCDNVTRSRGSGGIMRIGGTLSPTVLFGVEFFGFSEAAFSFFEDDKAIRAEGASIAAIALWYPWRSHIFIKGGVGAAEGLFTVSTSKVDSVQAEGIGVGLTFGIGMDVPISRKFAITGNIGTYFSAIGDIVLPAGGVDDVIPTTWVFALGLTIR